MEYKNYRTGRAKKQSQNKPNSNPIQTQFLQRPKLMQSVHILNSLQYKASSIIVLQNCKPDKTGILIEDLAGG